eukprot:4322162-Karenia_brevis.AAC.1
MERWLQQGPMEVTQRSIDQIMIDIFGEDEEKNEDEAKNEDELENMFKCELPPVPPFPAFTHMQ